MRFKISILTFLLLLFFSTEAFSLRFVDDFGGTYCIKDDNLQATNEWVEKDGKYYYFGNDHYLLKDTITPDGYKVDASGAWDGSEKVEVDGSNRIVMPTDTYSFKKQQSIKYYNKLNEANNDFYQGKISKDELEAINKSAKNSLSNGSNTTTYDYEMKKKNKLEEIEDNRKKLKELNDKYNQYVKEGLPQEILDIALENMRLYNNKIAKLEQEYARMQ